jgi:hypothetical protein
MIRTLPSDPLPDPRAFRRTLATRLAAIVGTLSLAGTAGCWDGEVILTGFGGGAPTGTSNGGSTTTSSATTSSATASVTSTCSAQCTGAPQRQCFTPLTLPCPTDPCEVLLALSCDNNASGWQACQVSSGPMQAEDGSCCYQTTAALCTGGGRPYLVEERAVVAAPIAGGEDRGWRAGDCPDVSALTTAERAALAEAWTANGLLEHASVASFARVSLSLLAAGAPADLLARTQEAALDEILHARLCFALASAYRGETVSPGPFPVAGAVSVATTLAAVAASAVEEGCVGETVAAIVAAEQLARATDPAVRAALSRIAADEARHAELAWATVAWAVRTGGAEVREAVRQAILGVLGRVPVPAPSERPAGERVASMEAHGCLDAATVASIAAGVLVEVVGPAARALLQHAAPPRPAQIQTS